MRTTTLLASAVALVFTCGVAMAQVQTKEKTAAKPRTAESIECSKQADAKGLHGTERKKFRSKCRKDLLAAKKPA